MTAEGKERQDGRGGFFAADARTWRFVCRLGLNAAVAYLTLARGTGTDNCTTAWSTHAVESYAGIARSRAQAAIAALETAAVLRRIPDRSVSKPLYKLTPAHEIPGCAGYPPAPMSADEAKLHAALGTGWVRLPDCPSRAHLKTWQVVNPLIVAEALAEIGHVEFRKDGRCRAIHYDAASASQPAWIWLPNALVDGARDETPALQLLRQAGDVATLRLMVELYGAHTVDEDRGVHFRQVRQSYDRFALGERGQYAVWGFRPAKLEAFPKAPFIEPFLADAHDDARRKAGWAAFWQCLKTIEHLGLIEWVAHLVEADSPEAEIIFPLALPGTGLPIERDLHKAAGLAAGALLTDAQAARANEIGVTVAAPVLRHIAGAAVVGVLRLRYRPKTARTVAFMAQEAEWREILDKLRAIGATASATAATSREIKGDQGNIKGHQGYA